MKRLPMPFRVSAMNRLFPDRVKPEDRRPFPLFVGELYYYRNEHHHSFDAVVKLLEYFGEHELRVQIVSGDGWVVGSIINASRSDLHLIEKQPKQ